MPTLTAATASGKGVQLTWTTPAQGSADPIVGYRISRGTSSGSLATTINVGIVSAYRHDRTGEGALREVYTFFYNLLIRRLFGVRMRDINFAFKLCRRSIFDHISLKSEGSFIDAELIIRARKLGYEVTQFGVDYFPRTRGESTLSSPKVILKIVREMTALRRELRNIQPVVTR